MTTESVGRLINQLTTFLAVQQRDYIPDPLSLVKITPLSYHWQMLSNLHSLQLTTSPLKIGLANRKLVFQALFFRFYVKIQRGTNKTIHTVDGRNPAPVDRQFNHPVIYQGFLHPSWLFWISKPSTLIPLRSQGYPIWRAESLIPLPFPAMEV